MNMMSLREQLLQAGLVSEKQVQDVERQQQSQRQQSQRQPPPKRQRDALSAQQRERERAAQQAQAAKAARDQEFNRKRQEKAEKLARQSQIGQLIEQHRLPKPETEERYNFLDGNKIRRISADGATRERIARGEIAIVRHHGRYDFVLPEIAERIRERDARAVIVCGPAAQQDSAPQQAASAEDDAYRDFPVPDDLMW